MNILRIGAGLALAASLTAISGQAMASPIQTLSGLQSIDIFEQTSGTHQYNFAPGSSQLLARLGDPLSGGNNDINSGSEFYDVYYSDADGNFNANGAFITIDAVYGNPGDTGLNLNDIRLNFASSAFEFGDIVTHVIGNGPLYFPASNNNAADGDLSTWTNMGNTDASTPRLSVTVGFRSSAPVITPVPEPLTLTLFGAGLVGAAALRRRKKA